MEKVLVLGAGQSQLNLIKALKKRGYYVIVADYFRHSPGKAFADKSYLSSTFDEKEILNIARKEAVKALFTLGTDQPVRTMGYVSEKLGLRNFLSYEQALDMTNKKRMKLKFTSCGIPTVAYQLITKACHSSQIHLEYPLVIKPLDSQGQRGIFLIRDFKELKKALPVTFGFTSQEEVLVERFYPSDEITVSGWVKGGRATIFTVVDRETFSEGNHIGICKGHRYPSRHFHRMKEDIYRLTLKIVEDFGIKEGPIYFQMLIGGEGLKVNEIAARIGGAYEDEYIPLVTGVDVLELLIDETLQPRENLDFDQEELFNIKAHGYIHLLFAPQGKVIRLPSLDRIPEVVKGRFFVEPGVELPPIENATQRIGYAMVFGKNPSELEHNNQTFTSIYWDQLEVTI
ncbi:MAG: hypothetical protein AVO33_05255 [delta proteobacterium ML8_F1]|nr:MAG: hypothetical protein AVO33_05255 [delta proteobacterium ML8_F1]